MKEKELRLAIVFYGGVSLAIYEHGISKEILNLIRASKASQASLHPEATQDFPEAIAGDTAASTEEVYRDLLNAIGRTLDLRVMVDVIAGSSAGGINGVLLARALAHDLTLDPLTEMWLADADLRQLLAPEAKARMWSKWYSRLVMKPLLARLAREGQFPGSPDSEMRETLSIFLRSRWFKPPLDGPHLTNLLLDALVAQGTPRSQFASLLPPGHRLDLLVTVTDFHGSERTIFIHDPPVVREPEHRHLLRFGYARPKGGGGTSDFGPDNLPSLAFAARASASYPGAFPPAQINEIDGVLAARQMPWPTRGRFLDFNFRNYRTLGINPEDAVLLDGSILDNKPIFAAVQALRSHAAFREVDRRLIYIDPHPYKPQSHARLPVPGFFTTLRGALSDLPRHEPVSDELAEISRLNEQIRRLKTTIAVTRPKIIALVEELTEGGLDRPFSLDDLRRWRIAAAGLMAKTEILYSNWFRSLLLESVDFIAQLIATVLDYPAGSPRARWVGEIIEAWAQRSGIFSGSFVMPRGLDSDRDLPLAGQFVVNFGVLYKRRRLTFVIQAINDLYPRLSEPGFCPTASSELDLLKRRLYKCLDALDVYDASSFLSADTVARARELFESPRATSTALRLPGVLAFVESESDALAALIDHLGRECGLAALNENTDAVLAALSNTGMGANCLREIMSGYLGFVYWDIVLLPTTSALNLGAGRIEEILVDRISPDDATTLAPDREGPLLLGGTFAGFGGFLSRAIRENDYLWGRLHAIDRLFDLIASTAFADAGPEIDIGTFKRRAFDAVLRTEAARLTVVPDLISRIRTAAARL